MSAAPLSRTGFKFLMTIRDGPDAGASFQLLPPRVSIGRGSDCNVVLNDPRASRMAATIVFTMEKIVISDLSGRQTLYVNGELVTEVAIKDGDRIQIGDSTLTFQVEALPLKPQMHPRLRSVVQSGVQMEGETASAQRRVRTGGGISPRQRILLIAAVIGVAFVGLMLIEPQKPKKEASPRTIEEFQKEIEGSEKKQDEIRQKRVFSNDDEKTRFEEAQRHFNEGFRDYQKGQWVRAMRSFETARTIDPKHQLAARYFRLAEKERDAMIAALTLEGRRYREKNMFARCSAQFEKVLDMIPNKEDVKYRSAEALKKECELQLEGRFL
jgi:pSer/pThr/pTyr-binding forkhead associated (FHA) protein